MDEPRGWRTLTSGLLLALASCGSLDLTGKLCSSARPCPSGWQCSSGTCRLPGTGNQVVNGDFEAGITGWTTRHGSLTASTPGRSSSGASTWTPDGTAQSALTLLTPAVEKSEDGTWCASAWIQTDDSKPVTLQLLQAGDPISENTGSTSGVWTRIDTNGLGFSSAPISVALTSDSDAGTRILHVDDVSIWRPQTGDGCTSGP